MSKNYATSAQNAQQPVEIEPRDRPLLMGYETAPELMRRIGLSVTGDRPFDQVVGSILADMLIGHGTGHATAFSLHKANYTALHRYHPLMTYTNVRRAMGGLDIMGLIEVEKGKSWKDGGRGKQSRCWASDLLIELAGDAPTLTPRVGPLLVLKDSEKNLIGFRDTDRTMRMERDIRDQNEAIASTVIRIEAPDIVWVDGGFVTVPGLPKKNGRIGNTITIRTDLKALRRIGNNGSWTQGMRYYNHFCQGLPKARRQQLTFGGMPVTLLDFTASHPSILYAQAGAVMDGDPYEVPGFLRDDVKLALLILVNAANRHQAIEAMAFRIAQTEAETDSETVAIRTDHREVVRRLFSAISERHEPIKGAFCTGIGTKLQYIEAEVIGAVMRAARKAGIVTLPVHDEVICTERDAGRVTDMMIESWVSKVGSFPGF
ncbi:hypothetical protein ACRAWG_21570 [Methylobacterium sp. P31]